MQQDIVDLREFYARPLGGVVRRILANRIRARWRSLGGLTVFGLGYATPYLGAFREEAMRLGALMPAAQGVAAWPEEGPSHTALVEEDLLPLTDSCVDRLLAVHCLESSESARSLLRELWRVLAPGGRLLLVVPNRRSVWAQLDTTPFGHGQPYSRGQLARLLRETMFTPLEWTNALYMPPLNWPPLLRWAVAWERLGAVLWPAFSGVILVEATKQIHAVPVERERREIRARLQPVPTGPATARTMHERQRDSRNTACSPSRFWTERGAA